METGDMHLKILLPYRVFAEKGGVRRIVADTPQGLIGLLPERLDCVTALRPGIFSYETEAEGEVHLALDEGVLVKTGRQVYVSVRNATGGTDLGKLHELIEREFLDLNEQEVEMRNVLAKLESSFVRRLLAYRHE